VCTWSESCEKDRSIVPEPPYFAPEALSFSTMAL